MIIVTKIKIYIKQIAQFLTGSLLYLLITFSCSNENKDGLVELTVIQYDSIVKLHIEAKKIIVDWDDGKTDTYTSISFEEEIRHKYEDSNLRTIKIITEGMEMFQYNIGIIEVEFNYFSTFTGKLDTGKLENLRFNSCHDLSFISIIDSQLSKIDLKGAPALKVLYLYNNNLISLDVRKNPELERLLCWNNHISVLDVSKNTKLKSLHCYNNKLTALDISHNSELKELNCYGNQLTVLDVRSNSVLKELNCGNNKLAVLDVTNNLEIEILRCYENQLTALDVSKNTILKELYCGNNQLTTLDISNNPALGGLYCHKNQLTTLDVSKNPELRRLWVGYNPLDGSALNALFAGLSGKSGRVYVRNNPGLATCDESIAKNRGWKIYHY
jgi:hypothetical protein